MDIKAKPKKRKFSDKPLCKYGLSCYQRNPEHRKKFRHPAENETKIKCSKVNSLNETTSKKIIEELDTSKAFVTKDTNSDEPSTSDENFDYSLEEAVGDILKSMPKDFFDFWKFCASIDKSNPEDAFSEYGYYLVGIYDLLAKKLPRDMKVNISCHWRYYFDPPELQTVIKKDGIEWYHIGYFRDDPFKKPSILVSNSAADDSKLTVVGDNIFCAMNAELDKVISCLNSKVSRAKATKLQKGLRKFAAKNNYKLNVKTDKTEKRRKKVVAETFNGLGIVVPVKNDIGYRPLPESEAGLKNILKRIVATEDKDKQLEEQEKLDEIISNVHFANDECDYGMGLELGLDLFCDGHQYFHEDIMRVLPLAYDLLNRSKYASIVRAHIKYRKEGDLLDTLYI